MRAFRSAVTIGVIAVVPLAFTPSAYAAGGIGRAHDNIAWAESTAAHPTTREVAFGVVAALGDTVDQTNQAVAYNHDCTGCRSVAIAFQAVLVPSTPTRVVPENVAVTVNDNCTGCNGFSYAEQYVVSSNGRTRLDGRTMDGIERIRDQAERIARSSADDATKTSQLADLANKFEALVKASLTRGPVDRDDRDWSDA
ncbi:MAG: putative peptide zinc metalloprotease protein [Frankiaceae bacterium]|nr:putative peptide zinc metalloprotease protein [Frankiaceae bacterium]MDX6274876.1 putative peptide zinc metalloprotease protein [Frankiales bacterium]